MRKIVFYQPPSEALRAYSDAEGREQIWLPHGLLCVAAMLDESAWESCLVDGRLSSDGGLSDLKEKVGSSDILACSVITGHAIRWALKASEIATLSGIKTIWGGPHPTLFPRETLANPFIDFIIIKGRGEEPFAAWARAFNEGSLGAAIPGVGYKRNGELVIGFDTRHGVRLPLRDQLPPPRLDLVSSFEPYLMNDLAISSKTINHVTSIGCPYSCIFCSETALSGRAWYAWSAKRSLEEITRLLKASGAKGLKLHDALFFVDMKRALSFACGIKTLQTKWAATMHPFVLDRISLNDLAILRDSGLSRLMVGFESGNQFVVNLVGKQFSVCKIPEMASKLRDAGIIGMFSFIVGFPTAPKEEYPETIQMAHEIHRIWEMHQVKIHYASPWPGTKMWALASNIPGFSPPRTLLEWSEYDYYNTQMVFHNRSWEREIETINREYCPYYHA